MNLLLTSRRVTSLWRFHLNKLALFAIGLIATVAPALAHHSAAAEYDVKNTVTLKGTVTKVEWQNPHVRFYVDVKDADGKITNWEIETGSPNILLRGGFTRNSLKVGDSLTVVAYRAKDGANLGDAVDVTLPDGRKMNASPSTGNGQ